MPENAPPCGDCYILRIGGARATVPLAAVRSVALACATAPLPLAGPLIEGLAMPDPASEERDPLPVVDGATLLGTAPGRGTLFLVVRATGGPVAIRVDHVAAAMTAEAGAPPPLPLDRLPPLAGEPPASRGGAPASARPVFLLLAEAGGRRAAFPAIRLQGMERVTALQEMPGRPDLFLAHLPGEVVCAAPLSPAAPGAAPPAWAALVAREGRRAALLLDAVLGLVQAPAEDLPVITLPDGRRTQWYRQEDGSLVEILDPAARFWPETAEALPCPPPARPAAAAAPTGTTRYLTLRCGEARLALPAATAGQVLGRLPPSARRGGLPVLDLAVLLGLRDDARAGQGLRPVGRGWILAADAIGPLRDIGTADWHPLPALPAATAALLDAVTPDPAGGWLYRLRADPPRSVLTRPLGRRLAMARRGWVEAAPHDTPHLEKAE